MNDNDIAALAVKLADILKAAPQTCLHTADWATVQAERTQRLKWEEKLDKKVDLLTDAVSKMRGDRNVIVALIGAVGVVVGTSIPFIFPPLIKFFRYIT